MLQIMYTFYIVHESLYFSQVEPFAGIVDSVRLYIPRVLFNRAAVGPFQNKRRINDSVVAGKILPQN